MFPLKCLTEPLQEILAPRHVRAYAKDEYRNRKKSAFHPASDKSWNSGLKRNLACFALLQAGFVLLAALSGCSLSTPPSQTEVVEQALPKGTRIPPPVGLGFGHERGH